MNNIEKNSCELEILIATMNRDSLDFLSVMFQNNDLDDYQILIINQTTESNLLKSNKANIRVINSFERGISKSRNLAVNNAIGEICLLADDDVIYLKHFEKKIVEAYKNNNKAYVLTFKTLTTEGKPYSNYPQKITTLFKFYRKILSIEITFKTKELIKSKINFNENFGLGATFEEGENVFFFRSIFEKGIPSYFVPETIVIHKPVSSSDDVTSDRYIFGRAAMHYKLQGSFAYFYAIKLMFALLRRGLIGFDQVIPKFNVALKGIRKYKQIQK